MLHYILYVVVRKKIMFQQIKSNQTNPPEDSETNTMEHYRYVAAYYSSNRLLFFGRENRERTTFFGLGLPVTSAPYFFIIFMD